MSEILIDKLVVAVGCGLSLYACFGRKGLPASILAVVIAWMYQYIAIGICGGLLALFLVLSIIEKKSNKEVKEENKDEIIDVEFTVLGEE